MLALLKTLGCFSCSKEEALTVMGLKPELKTEKEFRWLYDLGE